MPTPLLEAFACVDDLPSDALDLLASTGLFGAPTWWRVVQAHAMEPRAEPVFVTVRIGGSLAGVVPMQRRDGRLSSLTTPYSCAYAPPLPDAWQAGLAIARHGRRGVVRVDAIPAEWEKLAPFCAGATKAGRRALRFDHFGNWSEDVAGLDWSGYLQRRPGALRETIRRRLRKAERLPDARFLLLSHPEEMDQAAAAFESVYARSWKDPEPFPAFNVVLMRAMAAQGALRFGLWALGDVAVAVQVWVVWDRQAIVLKLAHDEAFKAHSPGTVLTALMLRHLLDREQVVRIDFGRGDDPYKQGWASERRQRIGLLLVNPWTVAGAVEVARHAAGRLRARWQGTEAPQPAAAN